MLSILCYRSVFQKLKLSHTTKCHEEGFTPVCVSQAVHTASATVRLASKACNDLKYSLGAEKLCFRATCSHCLIFIRRGLCACVFSPRNGDRDKCQRGVFGFQFTAWSPINWGDVVFAVKGGGVSQNQLAWLNWELGQTLAATTHFRAQRASWF